jgi:hypothetical protein
MAFGTGVFYVCGSKAKAQKINMNEIEIYFSENLSHFNF